MSGHWNNRCRAAIIFAFHSTAAEVAAGLLQETGGNVAFPGYDFTSHFVDIDGKRMHYLDEGAGDTVVMLHGNPNWSYYYRNLIQALRDRYRCLAPDHIGCGLSDKPGDDQYEYSLARRVADLEIWLDRCQATSNLTLVVHDWGGMIGMAYATRHPERIRRLVVLNTGAFHLPQSRPVPWQLKLARSPIGGILVRGLNAFSRGAVRSCVTRRPMPADVANAYCAPYDSWAHRIAVHRFVQDIPLKSGDRGFELVSEVENRLELLKHVPMFIGWGDRDFVFDENFLRQWQTRFPDAELHRYPDCGHYILEDASDELIPLIRQFLDVHPL
jgi:pimeloyl-ACP methyl ester carboxylesterase